MLLKSTNNKLATILLILFLVSFFIAGFFARGYVDKRETKNAQQVAQKAVDEVLSGNLEKVYNESSESLKEEYPIEEFKLIMSNLQTDSANKLNPIMLSGVNNKMFIQYVDNLPGTESGRTSGEFYIGLVKEGKDWKVASVSIQ